MVLFLRDFISRSKSCLPINWHSLFPCNKYWQETHILISAGQLRSVWTRTNCPGNMLSFSFPVGIAGTVKGKQPSKNSSRPMTAEDDGEGWALPAPAYCPGTSNTGGRTGQSKIYLPPPNTSSGLMGPAHCRQHDLHMNVPIHRSQEEETTECPSTEEWVTKCNRSVQWRMMQQLKGMKCWWHATV